MQYHLERLKKLEQSLEGLSCDALLIEDPINLYYLVGIELSEGKILIHKNGSHLIVDSRYYEACLKKSPIPVVLSKVDILIELLRSKDFSFISKFGFNNEKTTYKRYLELRSILVKTGRKIELLPLETPVEKLRIIKDQDEIKTLREAADLGSEGFDFVCSILKEGITEAEVAMELEIFWKRKGSKGLAFDPIIAFGPNSSMPHYRAGNVSLKQGDAVLIDIGVNWKHYHSDMTRVVFFGQPDPKINQIYQIVKKAQELSLQLCKPKTTIAQLDDAARGYITSQGFGDQFTHNLGHGVGLEIHEAPGLRNISPQGDVLLKPGMVITIEPGIYLSDVGGVRIEDTVVITDEGHENLTKRSKDITIINQRER
jgi:Xaa-Pro aminopeptidase